MKKRMVKVVSLLLVAFLLLASFPGSAQAATIKLGAKSVTLSVGETKVVKLKNNTDVTAWSVSDECIAMLYTSEKQAKIIALKEGSATLTAKVNGKKYKCKVTVKGEEKEETKRLVYEDENVKIYYTGLKKLNIGNWYGVNFYIENFTERTIVVQLEESSINGTMVDPFFSLEISPGKNASDSANILSSVSEMIPMENFKEMETKFNIFDENDLFSFSDDAFRYTTETITIEK